jgi:hemerythrin-like domain-containing protein
LRGHIDKENDCLFAMADSAFSENDQEDLCRAFAAFESAEMGEGVHARYHKMAHELAGDHGPSCSHSA